MYFAAGATTLIALIILWALQPFERMYSKRFKQRTLRITTGPDVNNAELLKDIFSKKELEVQTFTLDKNEDGYVFQLKFESMDAGTINTIISELKKDPTIKEVFWSQ
jgi:putative Mg2+ transporter-C (MgtC) family protein